MRNPSEEIDSSLRCVTVYLGHLTVTCNGIFWDKCIFFLEAVALPLLMVQPVWELKILSGFPFSTESWSYAAISMVLKACNHLIYTCGAHLVIDHAWSIFHSHIYVKPSLGLAKPSGALLALVSRNSLVDRARINFSRDSFQFYLWSFAYTFLVLGLIFVQCFLRDPNYSLSPAELFKHVETAPICKWAGTTGYIQVRSSHPVNNGFGISNLILSGDNTCCWIYIKKNALHLSPLIKG